MVSVPQALVQKNFRTNPYFGQSIDDEPTSSSKSNLINEVCVSCDRVFSMKIKSSIVVYPLILSLSTPLSHQLIALFIGIRCLVLFGLLEGSKGVSKIKKINDEMKSSENPCHRMQP